MHEARAAWATLAQFPEGALVYPGKRVMSSAGPDRLGEADWSRANWDVLREEAEAVASLAAELRLWTVFGSLHPLTPPRRPHNYQGQRPDPNKDLASCLPRANRFVHDCPVSRKSTPVSPDSAHPQLVWTTGA